MKTQYKHLLQRTYLVLVFGFMYLPIAVLIAYSLNENKSLEVVQLLCSQCFGDCDKQQT